MPIYAIKTAAAWASDASLNGATFVDIADPGDVTGLTNGTAYRAREVLRSDLSAEFTPTAGFTETGVVVTAGDYLTAPATISNAEGVLIFASFIQPVEGRSLLISWDGTDGGFWSDHVGTDSQILPRFDVETTGATGMTGPVAASGASPGDRIHTLLSLRMDGTTIRAAGTMWNATGGAWSTVNNIELASLDTLLRLSDTNIRLFADSTNPTNQRFAGTVYRLAMWTFADDTTVPDVSLSGVRDNFTNAGALVNPATARSAYGTPVFDFSGNAAAYNAGTHDGSLASFTATGTFE